MKNPHLPFEITPRKDTNKYRSQSHRKKMEAKEHGLWLEEMVARALDFVTMRQKMADMVIYGYNPATGEINYTNEVTPE